MKPIILTSDTLPVLSGCNFGLATEPIYHPDRTLDFHILLYVVSGCIYVTEGETDYELHEGDVLFLHSGIRHYGKKQMPKGTSWYFAHFYLDPPSETLTDLSANPHPRPNEAFRFQMELPKFKRGMAKSKAIELLASLADDLHSGNATTNLTHRATDYQFQDSTVIWNANIRLFTILTELTIPQAEPHLSSASKQSLSDRIAEYLIAHSSENFTAEALENHFFLSYKHMAAVFKKEKQMTLHQYHTRARMADACHLLLTTMHSIGEISEMIGYHDMLYFSRCFHQTIGMSPTEYRRRNMVNY